MKLLMSLFLIFCSNINFAQKTSVLNVDKKVDSVLRLMSLKEKIGQLNQVARDFETGTKTKDRDDVESFVQKGNVGSFLNLRNIDDKITMQKFAMKSRLKIPLIFGFDVIHGHNTIFPIPLAQAASWDIAAIEKAERIAATEAASEGINWTFAPMVDITYDPRWGRIMEGSGEDPYLGSLIAAARVKGFQGNDLSLNNTIIACAKHFAAYGFAEGGRDYNTVDMSEQRLRNVVLPPFKAAADAGVGTFMNSFNTLNGVPASMHKHLLSDILKGEWGFKGFVVSDWGSFDEIMQHGTAYSRKDIALKVMNAGSDMDMESKVFIDFLEELVNKKAVNQNKINESVKRILRIKFMLGLFDNPFRYLDKEYRRSVEAMQPTFVKHAKEMAQKSIVLLKNDNNILPLEKNKYKKIAIIGPLANGKLDKDYLSFWTFGANQNNVVTLYEGMRKKYPNAEIVFSNAGDTLANIEESIDSIKNADLIVVALGEHGINNGEARSYANLSLQGAQLTLLTQIKKLNKPTVVVLFTGRVIIDKWLFENMQCIVNAWQPGQEAGNAIADVLSGDYNPSGRLPLSWPRSVGQIPLYYNCLNTGRPKVKEDDFWVSRYRDESNEPLFAFGYGLSYSNFSFKNIKFSDSIFTHKTSIKITVDVKNESDIDGEELVQLFIRDLVADISRPVKELKAFEKIFVKARQTKTVSFIVKEAQLKYWNNEGEFKADNGEFIFMVGKNAAEIISEQKIMLK